ncbi:MAG: hypothetical protein M0Z53_08455 [Thermaerobacter sp.]|nr:hypothetical protein [Thermaerobacter sp.]
MLRAVGLTGIGWEIRVNVLQSLSAKLIAQLLLKCRGEEPLCGLVAVL